VACNLAHSANLEVEYYTFKRALCLCPPECAMLVNASAMVSSSKAQYCNTVLKNGDQCQKCLNKVDGFTAGVFTSVVDDCSGKLSFGNGKDSKFEFANSLATSC
jgi:hypothetical protein